MDIQSFYELFGHNIHKSFSYTCSYDWVNISVKFVSVRYRLHSLKIKFFSNVYRIINSFFQENGLGSFRSF